MVCLLKIALAMCIVENNNDCNSINHNKENYCAEALYSQVRKVVNGKNISVGKLGPS